MGRVRRSELPDGTYQLTTRGVVGADIYLDDVDRVYFLKLLRANARRFGWRVDAFCLMTTHYHVVVTARIRAISDGMRRLNGDYARGFNQRHGRRCHLFSERFSSWLIEEEQHLENTIRYVLLNPVRAGLCRRTEDWPWSASTYGKTV